MDCVRINCAHDDEAAWARMVDHVRRAEQAMGRKCHVLMDLAGPKIRTVRSNRVRPWSRSDPRGMRSAR